MKFIVLAVCAISLVSGCGESYVASDCIKRKDAGTGTLWNMCNYPVNTYYCRQSVAGSFFDKPSSCKSKHVKPGEVMTIFHSPDTNSGILSKSFAEKIFNIRACKSPKRPIGSSGREFTCE